MWGNSVERNLRLQEQFWIISSLCLSQESARLSYWREIASHLLHLAKQWWCRAVLQRWRTPHAHKWSEWCEKGLYYQERRFPGSGTRAKFTGIGFEENQSYQSCLTNENVWSYVLASTTIRKLSKSCLQGKGMFTNGTTSSMASKETLQLSCHLGVLQRNDSTAKHCVQNEWSVQLRWQNFSLAMLKGNFKRIGCLMLASMEM